MERRTAADNHRLGRLFAAWHTAALASSASSTAVVRSVHRRRDTLTLAADFRAWASLSRARRWRRRRCLRRGLETLACFAEAGVPAGGQGRGEGCGQETTRVRQGQQRGLSWMLLLPPVSSLVQEGQRARVPVGRIGDVQRGGGGGGIGHTYDSKAALASAHRRRTLLLRGLRALRLQVPGSGGGLLGRSGGGRPFYVVAVPGDGGDGCGGGGGGNAGGGFVVVGARAARGALTAWCEAARAARRAREAAGMMGVAHAVWRRHRVIRAVRALRVFAMGAARQRRAARRRLLRKTFVALRQVRADVCLCVWQG